jgi:hypothetical protein
LVWPRFNDARLADGTERWHLAHAFILETVEAASETATETATEAAAEASAEAAAESRPLLKTAAALRLRSQSRGPGRRGLAWALVMDTLKKSYTRGFMRHEILHFHTSKVENKLVKRMTNPNLDFLSVSVEDMMAEGAKLAPRMAAPALAWADEIDRGRTVAGREHELEAIAQCWAALFAQPQNADLKPHAKSSSNILSAWR